MRHIVFPKNEVNCKINLLSLSPSKTFYILKICKLANRKMVLLQLGQFEIYVFLIRSLTRFKTVRGNAGQL